MPSFYSPTLGPSEIMPTALADYSNRASFAGVCKHKRLGNKADGSLRSITSISKTNRPNQTPI